MLRRPRLRAEPGDEQRQPERRDVREHVSGIGEQRERVRQQPADALGDQKQRREHQRQAQTPHVGRRRRASARWPWLCAATVLVPRGPGLW